MKDGDKVLVECESEYFPSQGHGTVGFTSSKIKLNSEGYITLHECSEKMVSTSLLEKAYNAGWEDKELKDHPKDFKGWFEQNVK